MTFYLSHENDETRHGMDTVFFLFLFVSAYFVIYA